MSRTAKIVLGVVAGVFVVCLCIAIVGAIALNRLGKVAQSSFNSDPATVASVSSSIVDCTLPPGYAGAMSIKLLGISMVGYSRDSDNHFIMLMQLPSGTDMEPAEMERQLSEAMRTRGYGGSGSQLKIVEQYPVTIRGQSVTATVSEGAEDSGGTYRQLMAAFEGKGGLALVMIAGPASRWTKSEVDGFLASMR